MQRERRGSKAAANGPMRWTTCTASSTLGYDRGTGGGLNAINAMAR